MFILLYLTALSYHLMKLQQLSATKTIGPGTKIRYPQGPELQASQPNSPGNMAASEPVVLASPKFLKVKPPQAGVPLYGCGKETRIWNPQLLCPKADSHKFTEHLQLLLSAGSSERMKNTIQYYKNCLRVIFDNTPIVPQTSKTPKGQPLTSLTPNYLCLQCTTTTTATDRIHHGTETLHRFCMK